MYLTRGNQYDAIEICISVTLVEAGCHCRPAQLFEPGFESFIFIVLIHASTGSAASVLEMHDLMYHDCSQTD